MIDKITGMKNLFDNLRDTEVLEDIQSNMYAFISLNNGTGAKTVATQIAVEMSKENKRVGLIDMNFIQPGLSFMVNETVTKDKSILQYFNAGADIKDCIIPVKERKNMWLVSTSPLDIPLDMAEINHEMLSEMLDYFETSFDYVIMYMSYLPLAEWFVYTLEHIDKGYIIWDEQLDNILKTKAMIDFVHQISYKANSINNIVLNKTSDEAYNFNAIDEIQCNFIGELPYIKEIQLLKNEGKLYLDKKMNVDKKYRDGVEKIIKDMYRKVLK